MASNITSPARPKTQSEWKQALAALPDPSERDGRIPAFFFGHGQPMLIYPESAPTPGRFGSMFDSMGPKSDQATFLKDFGPALLKKYNPKAIVVFSAHWESDRTIDITNYEENPLLYDYYGFNKELYEVEFKSKGDEQVSRTVLDTLNKASIRARLLPTDEPRGYDGRGGRRPGYGLDHGVFVPFLLMFKNKLIEKNIPLIEVSIDGGLSPQKNWALGKALNELRSQGILILSGGLTIHTFEDFSAFDSKSAKPLYHEWHDAVVSAAEGSQDEVRKKLMALVLHPGFRKAHPREEHFVPIYVAGGAGDDGVGETRIVADLFGAPTIAFGV